MYYDPLVALANLSPVEKLSDETNKKKSRWGNSSANTNVENKVVPSKWGPEETKPYLPLPFVDLPPGLTPSQLDQFLREQRYDELTKKLNKGELEYVDPDIRPPSPPPIYDKNGSRINTREARVRNCMIEEYHRLVEYLLKHVDGFVAPPNYKPIKKVRKIEIPIDKYPEYNFMGLIIGPRGCNHKRLEAESGAQISIRGKGTLKEGKKTDHQTEIEANMPKHVHISADNEECVERAVSLITPLLDPFHPLHDEYKKKGLEQLALVNGININQLDVQRCSMCNSTLHMTFECPENMNLQNFKKPEIKCNLCGDHGHITLDCKLAKQNNTNADFDPSSEMNTASANNGIVGNIPAPPSTMPPPPYDKPRGINPYGQTSRTEKIKIDLEYQRMMNELNPDKESGDHSNDKDMIKNGNESIYATGANATGDFPPPSGSLTSLADINMDSFSNNNPTPNYADLSTIFPGTIGSGKGTRGGRGGKGSKGSKNFNNGLLPPPMNSKNKNNPNLIPLGHNGNVFADDLMGTNTASSFYDSHSKNGRNNSQKKNSNNNNFNTSVPNYQNANNIPLNAPMPPMLPNFFNFPFMNNGMVQGGSVPFPSGQQIPPGQQLPMDPLYMQGFPGWPQMPMGFSDDLLAHAAAPDTNPPPLPSEGMNNEDSANVT
ncbi:conserved Plasmodium protein, unknown function [Plasmodium knowlesi strain H]|uniref:Branchpoint-bridging protein n=3 Tax=Plasmodium knowlesi TaxID=5850 RepID=A0A5K1U8L2_PLAKH|nr:conserved Plasmodium protein, unknown function [Plasmodium knowlesi strain H]OTN64633.1 Uncharacterized protein PKNOH_S130193100 [Plasmodium knowlesi]CAA9989094.1 conserved Plasmodium protein, unknown function [Plasmodium knowlesi strain H]SBO27308.1 conserved Plasmodium protein, unknown function [Plasmodium knowlesi strain H]SBO28933.1 conserved Plasmodium protein, unknown function [Plasmodium knowlesi strain H]VVS78568.1 conserved Plasmodium protein, unknown function [Plasmodium knowlesi |eukprot:XP_002261441.1 hypothetical protein, conserved in Plasmodium species [Plasmodium knowlesi strain H]